MDGSKNIAIRYNNNTYHILYVGIHGGSGMGANDPYNGRYYLVTRELWEKEKDDYCMVHDSILPRAWKYYENNGILLCEDQDYPESITDETLTKAISRLAPEIIEILGE